MKKTAVLSGIKTVALTAGLFLSAQSASAADKPVSTIDKTKEEWHFVQQHEQTGIHHIYVTDSAIKVVSQVGVSFICRAPEWRMYAYRDDDRVYRENSLAGYLAREGYNRAAARINRARLTRIGVFKKDGLTIGHYATKVDGGGDLELWLVESPVVPQPACDALLAAYHLMPTQGLLYRVHIGELPNKRRLTNGHADSLRLDASDVRTKDPDFLNTLSVKKITYNPKDFEYPRGYKPGSNSDLYTSVEQKHSLDDAFGDMGLGQKFGTK